MDRRQIYDVFRQRLTQIVAESGESRSTFAAAVGMDRSTLTQLLAPDTDRLPRAETLAAIAVAHKVSVDWLLGLSQQGPVGTDILRERMAIERDALSPSDERLMAWHAEAAGYKIRYAPSTLPDLLKTPEVIRYELERMAIAHPEQRIGTAAVRLAYQRRPETDMEACSPVQFLEAFVRGEGIWRDLERGARLRQIDMLSTLVDELYPTFRWFLYDGRRLFTAPITVFGPKRAIIYLGGMYFVFNSTEHIRALSDHFDGLIRGATTQPPDVPGLLRRLRKEIA
jgi:transcriptional regulator with XRE-family HTH domain